MNLLGVWENTTMRARRSRGLLVDWELGLMMRDVARREGVFIPCNVHMCSWFYRRGFRQAVGTAQTHGAPTTTAVGWYNNKHHVRCVWVVRKPVWTRQLHYIILWSNTTHSIVCPFCDYDKEWDKWQMRQFVRLYLYRYSITSKIKTHTVTSNVYRRI